VKAGEVVVQSGGCTLVGQALVQLARANGIVTVSVVQPSTEEEEVSHYRSKTKRRYKRGSRSYLGQGFLFVVAAVVLGVMVFS
jgi:NADPH:quinone reductase-like Zn-dependent oxidoreductase